MQNSEFRNPHSNTLLGTHSKSTRKLMIRRRSFHFGFRSSWQVRSVPVSGGVLGCPWKWSWLSLVSWFISPIFRTLLQPTSIGVKSPLLVNSPLIRPAISWGGPLRFPWLMKFERAKQMNGRGWYHLRDDQIEDWYCWWFRNLATKTTWDGAKTHRK